MEIKFYRRMGDRKWAWRLVADNNEIIATDGGQGYENKADAMAGAMLATAYNVRSIPTTIDSM